jgi:uncharacterized membrane protein
MPTDLPLHPALVHVPLGLAVTIPFVAIALAVAVWRGRLPRGALAVVAGLQLLLAGSAFAAMQLGHREERAAAQVAPRNAIHDHEEAGERVVWGSVAVLALAVGAVLVPARRAPLLAGIAAAGTLAVAALAVDAGRKGGELVFRYGAGAIEGAHATPGVAPASAPKADDGDE